MIYKTRFVRDCRLSGWLADQFPLRHCYARRARRSAVKHWLKSNINVRTIFPHTIKLEQIRAKSPRQRGNEQTTASPPSPDHLDKA